MKTFSRQYAGDGSWPFADDPLVSLSRTYRLAPADLGRVCRQVAEEAEVRAMRAGYENHYDEVPALPPRRLPVPDDYAPGASGWLVRTTRSLTNPAGHRVEVVSDWHGPDSGGHDHWAARLARADVANTAGGGGGVAVGVRGDWLLLQR